MFILLTKWLISPEGNVFSVISCVACLLCTLFTVSSVLCMSFRSVSGGNCFAMFVVSFLSSLRQEEQGL
jgi:hypothetical protein